jgi:tRNA-dihydrouridine synthase B
MTGGCRCGQPSHPAGIRWCLAGSNEGRDVIGRSAPTDRGDSAVLPPALRIGPIVIDPPVLQAPMAGLTNFAYRQIVRQLGGAGLLATEMVHARGFVWMDRQRAEEPERLWGVQHEPRPLAVQIWDNDPTALAEIGGRLAHQYGVSVVDINFGCPVRRVTERTQSGSYLLRYPDRVGAIVERVVAACRPTPVTAKIRLGCTRATVNAIAVAEVVEQAGAAALTVHGRTAEDLFRGTADWSRIAAIKPHLQRIPLIGNGDLTSAADVVDVFRRYDVDGVMIGRAGVKRPWLFAQVAAALRGQRVPPDPTLAAQRQLLLHHFELILQRFGPQKGTVLMRKYACCYAQGRRGAREFRRHVARVGTPAELIDVVARYFPCEPPDPVPD